MPTQILGHSHLRRMCSWAACLRRLSRRPHQMVYGLAPSRVCGGECLADRRGAPRATAAAPRLGEYLSDAIDVFRPVSLALGRRRTDSLHAWGLRGSVRL